MQDLKALQEEWDRKLKESGFDDIEGKYGELKVEIHPHYKKLAFQEKEFREAYSHLGQAFLWEWHFESGPNREIWQKHIDGETVRGIAQTLSLDRNQVWRQIKYFRLLIRVKYMNQINIRPFKMNDFDFVQASWLKSFKETSVHTRRIPKSVYYGKYPDIIAMLMRRSEIYVATLPDDDDVILGYVVSEHQCEEKVIHFLLVKYDFQKMGIGRALFNQVKHLSKIYFTHWTDPMVNITNRKDIHFIYDPYRI